MVRNKKKPLTPTALALGTYFFIVAMVIAGLAAVNFTSTKPAATVTVAGAPAAPAPHHWIIPRPPAPKVVVHKTPPTTVHHAPAPVRSTIPPVPVTAERPIIPNTPAPVVTAPPTTAAPVETGYGCAAALAYLATHAAPGFIHECPGYADGHQAMTCIDYPGVCPGEHIIAIADPCPAAYMNEASNSWVLEGLRQGAIDPYGYCGD